MQRTTRVMFTHYMSRNRALDTIWLRTRRARVLFGEFDLAMIKTYHIYSGDPVEMVERQQDYDSPLFVKARKRAALLKQRIYTQEHTHD